MATMIPIPTVDIPEAQPPRRLTAEELAALPEDGRIYELIEGEAFAMPGVDLFHSALSAWIATLLNLFVRSRHLGLVTTEQGVFLLARDPDTLRIPDVAFTEWSRVNAVGRHVVGAPDLAVEVVSTYDTAAYLQRKVQEYLAAGTRLVWVVYPDQTQIVVHTPQIARTLTAADTLDGGDVLPGFSAAIADIFAILQPPAAPADPEGQPNA